MLDGGPDAWFTSDGAYHGHAFYGGDGSATNYAIYREDNEMMRPTSVQPNPAATRSYVQGRDY